VTLGPAGILSRPWLRVPVLVAIGSVLVLQAGQLLVSSGGQSWGYDFSFYWLAGRQLLAGEPIYSAAQLAGPYAPQAPQHQLFFLYPPFFAVLIAPLSAIFEDYRTAMWLWAALGGILAAATAFAVGRAEGFERRESGLLVGLTLALPFVVFEMVMGNVHLVLLGLLAAAWLGLRRGTLRGEVIAGAMVGVAALIKLFPAVLLIWFVLTGKVRGALAVVVAAGVLAVATLPLTGIKPWLDYPTVLANLGPPVELWSSLAPTALLAEVMDFGLARLIVLLVGLTLLVWSARSHPPRRSFAIAVMVSLLVVPTIYPHYLALAVLPLLLAAAEDRDSPLPALAYLALLVGGELALLDLSVPVVRGLALIAAVAPLAALLLAGRRPLTGGEGVRGATPAIP
jgi:hypothetical protein